MAVDKEAFGMSIVHVTLCALCVTNPNKILSNVPLNISQLLACIKCMGNLFHPITVLLRVSQVLSIVLLDAIIFDQNIKINILITIQ